MGSLFYNLGRMVGPKVRKARWMWESLAGSEADAIRLEHGLVRQVEPHAVLQPDRIAPLLREVSRITGGRVLSLSSDPNDAKLYDYAGLRFPQTYLPLLRPLLLAWLAVFLLDVAVRRVAIDVRAALRRVRAWLTRTARQEQDQVISRLQARRQKLREQWSSRQAEAASRHYEGAQKYEGQLLSAEPTRAEEPPPKPETKEPEGPKKPPQTTHIDQLLQARRKKTGPEHDKGGTHE